MSAGKYQGKRKGGLFGRGFQDYCDSLKYAMHVIFRPFDGFWDLVHEKRGSLAAAHTYLFLFLLTYILSLMCTNFQFVTAPIQYINIYEQCASLLIPFLILCLSNWCLSTLFDGKGRFPDIYMAMCYALVPYILIQLPMVLLSHMISYDEAAYYNVLGTISVIWPLFLAFVGLMQVHDYSPGKNLIFLVATVFGALVILFLILVFFSLLSDAAAYFISLYREIAFRLY
ncbi:MAG: YIP1 family protein [Clostridia bacterium]|nr:YIP1 family protein [Clostridia bacterium]